MDNSTDVYVFGGEVTLELEGAGAMLHNYHIKDCYTKHIVQKGVNALVGLYVKEGYIKYKSLFDSFWRKKDVSGTVIWVSEHVLIDNYVTCNIVGSIPFFGWDMNWYKAEFSEEGKMINFEYDEHILSSVFQLGFEDALVNKPMKKFFEGFIYEAYKLGYKTCNRTDGEPVDAKLVLESKTLAKISYDNFYLKH